MSRRLAAMLAADVAGYSRLMGVVAQIGKLALTRHAFADDVPGHRLFLE